MAAEKITLTPEQEQIITQAFEAETVPSITDLIKLIFPDLQEVDGRSQHGRAIKIFLAKRNLSAKTKTNYEKRERHELTEEQIQFIRSNSSNMTPVEMARVMFGDNFLSNLNIETRIVADFVKDNELDTPLDRNSADEVPRNSYRPPKTLEGVLKRVEKYVFDCGINKESMTAQQKAGLNAMLGYMNTFRFVHQINVFESQTSRDLFESAFVRYCYDKPDLTEEEVDQYIILSNEAVIAANIQRRQELLSEMLETAATSGDERARISVGLVDGINTMQNEYHQSVTRQQKLLGDLKQKRSDRLIEQRAANASILNLVQLWKEERTRQKLLHLANARKKVVEKAAEELSSMSEFKARIMGISIEEAVNG